MKSCCAVSVVLDTKKDAGYRLVTVLETDPKRVDSAVKQKYWEPTVLLDL